jgi:hypothetical protein
MINKKFRKIYKFNQMKATITFSFLMLCIFLHSQPCTPPTSGAPNPPNKLCYNYDKCGNRIGQVPSWLDVFPEYYCPEITCTPNDPDYNQSIFRGRYFYPPWSWLEGSNISADGTTLWSPGPGWILYPWADDGSTVVRGSDVQARGGQEVEDTPNYVTTVFNIVPNPNVGQFRIEQTGFDEEKSIIKIYDNKSRLVYTREYINGEVNISEFSAGTYLLYLSDGIVQKSVWFIKKE